MCWNKELDRALAGGKKLWSMVKIANGVNIPTSG
jgi:hypothetical protein